MKYLILILAVLSTGCATTYVPTEDLQLNQTRTNGQVCDAMRSHLMWSRYEGAKLMRQEIIDRGFLTPSESKGLLYGLKNTGFTGFSKFAMICRFGDLESTGRSQYGSSLYEHFKLGVYYTHGTGITDILMVNGKVSSTYDY